MRVRDYLVLAAEHRGLVVFGAVVGVLCAAMAFGPLELVVVLPALALAVLFVAAFCVVVGRRRRVRHGVVVRRTAQQPEHVAKEDLSEGHEPFIGS